MNEVKDAINETNNEEPSVTDNSVINMPRYFKLFYWGKNFLNNIDTMYEWVCTENPHEKLDMSVLRYGRACILDPKENYHTNLSDTITTFNEKNKYPLSYVKIWEEILKVTREDE